ncbi:MAG: DNA-primase RepB domain-containing protein [Nostoc sp. DedSLP03]|uniref:DNA-primase RepB domain-containing protein n=1 Tax=Nostoc sp. DedSLP03 TaxID=3075400 RepID=UPI002AD51086|nr:DNA-primase RepB domain-containing protein [Nostoc sp. DedSLP03]MDZ7970626.1 DNA-primase RepB domain-containing protein [Nostoc sp. DedSLP03]
MEKSAREEVALAMVDLFASVDADRFYVTLTDIQGSKIRFRPNQMLQEVRHKIPQSLQLAQSERHNIILRLRVSDKSVFLVPLDDLKTGQLLKVEQAALFSIETSPGNFQAWLAIASGSNNR